MNKSSLPDVVNIEGQDYQTISVPKKVWGKFEAGCILMDMNVADTLNSLMDIFIHSVLDGKKPDVLNKPTFNFYQEVADANPTPNFSFWSGNETEKPKESVPVVKPIRTVKEIYAGIEKKRKYKKRKRFINYGEAKEKGYLTNGKVSELSPEQQESRRKYWREYARKYYARRMKKKNRDLKAIRAVLLARDLNESKK